MGSAASRRTGAQDWNLEAGLQVRHTEAGWPVVSLEVVLALTVTSQVHLTLEALGAQLTAERLEACVLAAVGDEVGALAEGFPTHLALVGLLTWGRDKQQVGSGGSARLQPPPCSHSLTTMLLLWPTLENCGK